MPHSVPTRPSFLPLLRELVRTYQAFERYSAAHVQTLGLTPAQFDVVATLGNTEGMNPKQLGEKTLITKGTLTGVIDRLQHKQLVERLPDPRDGRAQIVRLTAEGQTLFEQVFPAHGVHISRVFANVPESQQEQTRVLLADLRAAFESTLPHASSQP